MSSMFADTLAVSESDVILPVVPMFHANAWGLAHAGVASGQNLAWCGGLGGCVWQYLCLPDLDHLVAQPGAGARKGVEGAYAPVDHLGQAIDHGAAPLAPGESTRWCVRYTLRAPPP